MQLREGPYDRSPRPHVLHSCVDQCRPGRTATAGLATLQPVDEDQAVIVQWIATGAGTPAPVPSLTQQQDDLPPWLAGEELTDAEAIRSARAKQTDALLRTVLRVGVAGSSRAGAFAVCGRVWGQLRGLN